MKIDKINNKDNKVNNKAIRTINQIKNRKNLTIKNKGKISIENR
jgi:hypothetical protein